MRIRRHFVWVSSTTKGPFLPAYVQGPWHRLLTERLKGGVRLVGPTISCAPLIIDMAQEPIQHPHVQVTPPLLLAPNPHPTTGPNVPRLRAAFGMQLSQL